ncbi:MAG: hypothetical protein M0P69_11885 [Bacteroidales bacterium]|nr:hypothetical protein [Bacteroidales bacterium]
MAELQSWDVIDFAGINEKLAPHLVADSQAVDAMNVFSQITGKLTKRPGQVKLYSTGIGTGVLGLHGYYYGDGLSSRKLIAVFNDGVAYYWTGSAFTQIKTGLKTSAQVLFATCVNYCVGMNGVDPPWKYDGTTVSTLANAPATGRCPVMHHEQLFCIVDDDTIRWSDSFLPEKWEDAFIWMFDKGDGDKLSAMFVYGNELLVSKTRSIHKLSGTDIDNFRARKVESNFGVVGPRAGVVVGPYLYYISTHGIFRFDGLQSANIIDPPDSRALPGLPTTWGKVNKEHIGKAVAGYNKAYDCLWFHVPSDSSTTNNLVLVYSLKTGAWWKFNNIAASCMVDYDDGKTVTTYTGGAASGYIIRQNIGFNDMGSAISSYWVGKNFGADSPARIKKVKKVYVIDVKSLNDCDFSYRLNEGTYIAPTATSDKNDARKYQVSSGACRYFQSKLSHTVKDKDFAVSGMRVKYKPKKEK